MSERQRHPINEGGEFRGLQILKRENKTGASWHLRWSRPLGQGHGGYIYLGRFGSESRARTARLRAQNMIEAGIEPTKAHFNGGLNIVAPTRVRFGDVAEAWYKAQSVNWTSAETAKVKEGLKRRVVGFFGYDTEPETIGLEQARAFYQHLLAGGMKPISIRNLTSTAMGILSFAKVSDNPFRDKDLVRPRGRPEMRPLPLTKNLVALRAELSGNLATIWDILEHGGLRPSEACFLRWENVTTTGLRKFMGKNGTLRDVPVLPFQIDEGIDWLPKRPEGVDDKDFIIGTHAWKKDDDRNPLPSLDRDDLYEGFKGAAKRAKVPNVNPYALRHTHVSRLHEWAGARHNLSAKQQADRLGHRLDQAEDSYIQPLPSS